MEKAEWIGQKVHELYWQHDINCARTTLICLAGCFDVVLQEQTLSSAIGLHGAGGYRAQCGLVEGSLMFIGIYGRMKGKTDGETAQICYEFADCFIGKFGSLKCRDLRPGGFREDDPPHACETLTRDAILFAYEFVKSRFEAEPVG